MRTPPLNTLHLFDAAARHLNFRLAAKEMNLTQGAVAQQVRRLEKDLGIKLFHRRARGLALTEAGSEYSGPVRRAIAIIEEATQKLGQDKARIRLSVPPSFASKWLVPRLKSFTHNHPNIEVQTLASESLADFRSDEVDLAVRLARPPFDAGVSAVLLYPLELCAVCSADQAADIAPVQSVKDFIGQNLIHDGHDHWDRLLGDIGAYTTSRLIKFNHSALAIDAAVAGQGIALVPSLLVEAEIQQGKLVQIWAEQPSKEWGYYIVSPRLNNQNFAIQEMIDWLLSEAKNV